jgi:hypothetical protein
MPEHFMSAAESFSSPYILTHIRVYIHIYTHTTHTHMPAHCMRAAEDIHTHHTHTHVPAHFMSAAESFT